MVSGKGGNILIVEDDPGVARLQRRRLEHAGYAVAAAATADEAITAASRGDPDLVLLDYQLPGGVTGLQVFERLKQRGQHPPVILVTGDGDQTTVIRALRAGVLDFITKTPEYLDYLADSVERVLRQVRTERQLAESEARLAGIIHSAMDAIVTMDAHGAILEFNPAAEATFGILREEALGQEMTFLLLPDTDSATPMTLARSLTADPTTLFNRRLEVVGQRQDGTRFPAELTLTRTARQGQPLYTGYIRDISDQKRAAEHIKEQAALLDKANDAILVQNLENCIQFWNQSAERIYGWKGAEALGRNVRDLLFRGPSSALDKILRTVVARGEWTGELHQVTREGKPLIVASRWTLVRDAGGRPVSCLIINTDVTEKKQLESHLFRAQRMESLGTLAGGLAHDLNNVLTPIVLAAQLLQSPVPEGKRQSLLEALRTNAERGADMVKQVLAFARGAEGHRVPVQLRSLVKELTKILQHTFPKSIEISTHFPATLWPVSGDATQLYQVLMNLCVNARDAMLHGGRLRLEAVNLSADECFGRLPLEGNGGPHVCLTVADTGSGIPAAILERVFDPFFTTKEQGKGTGLGLSTALGIVRGHGGFISVASEVDRGTTFAVYLPALVTGLSSIDSREDAMLPRGRGELILLVDDEASVRDIARVTLETHGYEVLTAANGKEALELYMEHRERVEVVLTDLMMPVMDGPATIRALQALDPRVRIIVCSGMAGNGISSDTGVRALLPKPYTRDRLIGTLQDVLAAP